MAQLTRQTEDLKEARERLRLENEGLNNVVARKERLLQEVLERARKAEAEATQLKSQLKSETSTSKKTIREMESALSESTALSQKSEREYITLRDSIKGLVSGFKSDTEKLREEMRKREEKLRGDAESVGKKYQQLLEEVKNAEKTRAELNELRDEDKKKEKEVEAMWTEEVNRMKAEVEKHSKGSEEAGNTAKYASCPVLSNISLISILENWPANLLAYAGSCRRIEGPARSTFRLNLNQKISLPDRSITLRFLLYPLQIVRTTLLVRFTFPSSWI